MGTVDPESFDTLHSYANAFEMPFVTPLAPESAYHAPRRDAKQDFAIQIRPGGETVQNYPISFKRAVVYFSHFAIPNVGSNQSKSV